MVRLVCRCMSIVQELAKRKVPCELAKDKLGRKKEKVGIPTWGGAPRQEISEEDYGGQGDKLQRHRRGCEIATPTQIIKRGRKTERIRQ